MSRDIPDLEPVPQRFFTALGRDPLISDRAKSVLVDRALEGRIKLDEVRAKMEDSRQRTRLNDLRIEREELALRGARLKFQQEQEDLQTAANLKGAYDSILDSDLPDDEKHVAMDRLVLENPDAFARSYTLRTQHEAAKGILGPRLTESQRIAQEREARVQEQYGIKLMQDEIDAQRKAANELLEEDKEQFDSDFDLVRGLKFKGEDFGEGTPDELRNPNDKKLLVQFIRQYSAEDIDPESLKGMSARDLQGIAMDLRARQIQQFNRRRASLRDGRTAAEDRVAKQTGIPVE